MNFFRRGKPRDIYAVADIGSHTIRGLVFELSKENTLQPIKKTVFRVPKLFSSDDLIHELRGFLFNTVKSLGIVPRRIIIALGPHIGEYSYVSQTLDDIEKSDWSSRERIGLQFEKVMSSYQNSPNSILAYPAEVLVNGYPVGRLLRGSPAGAEKIFTHARTCTFRSVVATLPSSVGAALQNAKESLGGMPIVFVPYISVLVDAVMGGLGISDVFLIHMGGKETTLILLKEGSMIDFSIFPFGFRHFLEPLGKELSLLEDETEDLLRQYAKGLIPAGDNRNEKIHAMMATILPEWKKPFLESLEKFYPAGPLPVSVLLLREIGYLPEVVSFLQSKEWFQDFSYASPETRVLSPESFFHGDTMQGTLKNPEETDLAALMYYSLRHAPLF